MLHSKITPRKAMKEEKKNIKAKLGKDLMTNKIFFFFRNFVSSQKVFGKINKRQNLGI
jgi:hypothetical protein